MCFDLHVQAQDTIFTSDEYRRYSTCDSSDNTKVISLYQFTDTSGMLAFSEILLKQFTLKNGDEGNNSINLKNSNWYKIIIKNTSKKYRHFIFDAHDNFFNQNIITIYDTTLKGQNWAQNGSSLPDSLRQSHIGKKVLLTYDLDIGQTKTFFINVKQPNPKDYNFLSNTDISFGIASVDYYAKKDMLLRTFNGVTLGFLLLMFIYHLVLFVKIRSRQY